MKVVYSENNSGGNWWLTKENYEALYAQGWVPDEESGVSRTEEEWGRPYQISKEFPSLAAARQAWADAAGMDPLAQGCPCCGPPHYFRNDNWSDDEEDHVSQTRGVMDEILAERDRQDAKWGQQNHPDICKYSQGENGEDTCRNMGIPEASLQKAWVNKCAEGGTLAYSDIALEEFCEAVEENDPAERRKELVQLAAVVVAWIEAVDRRPK